MPEQGNRHSVGVLLKVPRSGMSDISARHDAQASFQPGGVLPFHARSVESVCLSDAVATLAVRDQIQLLIECRRVLVPDGTVLCAEDDAPATHAALSRWAELVGLVHAAAPHAGRAWRKRAASTETSPLVSILIPVIEPALLPGVSRQRDSANLPTHRDHYLRRQRGRCHRTTGGIPRGPGGDSIREKSQTAARTR